MIRINNPQKIIFANHSAIKTTGVPYTIFKVSSSYKNGDEWSRAIISIFVNAHVEGEKGDTITVKKIEGVNVKTSEKGTYKYETTLYVDPEDIEIERQAEEPQGFIEGWDTGTDEMPF